MFDARPALRLADVEGATAVDPQQTQLPSEWKSLPAYRLRPGETLKLTERRRGDADPAPDKLALHRVLWLDFDGGGYTWQDQLSGTLTRSWRLEMAPPSRLERVVIAGRDQVITSRADEAKGTRLAGVEIRQGQVLLGAEGQIPSRSPSPPWPGTTTSSRSRAGSTCRLAGSCSPPPASTRCPAPGSAAGRSSTSSSC